MSALTPALDALGRVALAVAQAVTPYQSTMQLIDFQLTTPAKHRLGQRPASETKARIRLLIESVFSNLKRLMRLEAHDRRRYVPLDSLRRRPVDSYGTRSLCEQPQAMEGCQFDEFEHRV